MEGSRHYVGEAFDMRTNTLTKDQINTLRNDMSMALGRDFDVVVEGDHIHCEFDKRGEIF